MKTIYVLSISVALVLMSTTPLYSQWKKSNVIQSNIYAFAYNNTAFFAQGRDLYKSVNDGAAWEKVAIEPKGSKVHDVIMHNQLVIASTDEGVYKSTDNGTTWISISSNLPLEPAKTIANKLFSFNSTIIAGVSGKGLFFSANNGDTWQEMNNGFDVTLFISCFTSLGSNIYVGTAKGIYVSPNNGKNWRITKDGFPSSLIETTMKALHVVQDNIYVGTQDGVLISSNNGTSWSLTPTKIPSTDVLCMASKAKSLLVGTSQGMYMTSNNGTTWESAGAEISFHPILSIVVKGDQVYTGTYASGYYSRNVFEIVSEVSIENTPTHQNPNTWCYPNPASDNITITTPPSMVNNTSRIRYSVINQQGEEVMYVDSDNHSTALSTKNLSSGMYIIIATCGIQRTATTLSILR